MKRQTIFIILLIAVLAVVTWRYITTETVKEETPGAALNDTVDESRVSEALDSVLVEQVTAHANLIVLNSPQPLERITSPLTVTGKARGYWFFEASFPVTLTNWDGLIIAEGYATAVGDWMTEDFVPFTATLEFVSPYVPTDPAFMSRGSLILKKDNPSGLPEHDDTLEIPIHF